MTCATDLGHAQSAFHDVTAASPYLLPVLLMMLLLPGVLFWVRGDGGGVPHQHLMQCSAFQLPAVSSEWASQQHAQLFPPRSLPVADPAPLTTTAPDLLPCPRDLYELLEDAPFFSVWCWSLQQLMLGVSSYSLRRDGHSFYWDTTSSRPCSDC
mmetsp:Transcript_23386/g.41542  ORF Transcript_23386/g.41542 Transcript_23386/m.41542 type:complete len:154 (-) Transcript_23386:426-887(-)